MVGALFTLAFAGAALTVAQGNTLPATSEYILHPTRDVRPDGKVLYGEYCSSCHGDIGEGTKVAPPLIGIGAGALDFMLSTGRMPAPYPAPENPRHASFFAPRQEQAIISYLDSLSGNAPGRVPMPHVDISRGDLTQGRQIFARSCAACHSAGAVGATVGYGEYAPDLAKATPTQIGEAIRLGPSVMPRFGRQTIGDADLNSLAKYVVYLRRSDNPGGADLGGVGPVSEGFAGFIGLFAIVLVARFIGTAT